MIRHTVEVAADPTIKNAQLTASLPGLSDGDSLKLIQDDHQLFLTFRQVESMSQNRSKKASLPLHLMRLNRIQQGSCIIQQCHCGRISHLKVRVSELDWKIVNEHQIKIAQSFLEQVSIVWPQGAIPIYYDEVNYVTLRPECEQAGKLDINTTVEFIEEGQEKQGKNGEEEENQEQQEEESDEEIERQVALSGFRDCEQGWLNVINISHSLLEKIKIGSHQPWIVNNNTQFESCPTIDELTDLQKQRQSPQASKQPLSFKKLVILQSDRLSELSQDQYECSKVCKKSLGISDSITISHLSEFKPNVEILSWELFINDSNWSLEIEELIMEERQYTEMEYIQFAGKIMKKFEIVLAEFLSQKGSFFILPDLYPFCLDSNLLLLRLKHKKNQQKPSQIYQLKPANTDLTTQQYHNLLTKNNKLTFTSKRYPIPEPSTLEDRYNTIGSWISVLREFTKQQKQKHQQSSNTHEQATITLFTSIYQPQIDKMMNFLQNSSHQVCLVTSLGSNGKSLLHKILQKQHQPMWKVNMRQLTSPSLTYSNIEFYLHWVFANSPYKIVFLDDLDALCAKVEEGDQLKKKEKVVSRLILRTIERYAGVYRRRIIVTARSENSLDELFKYNTHIALKNPNREARINAMKDLHIVVEPDDSPVHRLAHQLHVKKVTADRVQQIAQSTESLTLAAFAQHAIALTVPENKGSSSAEVDFSKLAGLQQAKAAIRSIIEKPIKYAFLFKSVPIKLPRGVLLYGATGNGKSALGSALKAQFKMKYFSVKGSDILSKYIGGSQAAVRDIFQKALSVSPSIIFFDQFQSIVPRRSSNNTGVNDRIVNQFLCYLDGVSSTAGVFIVAASSRPDLIDPAVLRPGRLDAHLFLDYPREEERKELLRLFGNSVEIDVDEEIIVKQTEGYSYSDLIGLMKELRIKRSAQVLKMEKFSNQQFKKISAQLFKKTIQSMKMSVTPQEQKRQRIIYESFRDGKTPDVSKQRQIQQ